MNPPRRSSWSCDSFPPEASGKGRHAGAVLLEVLLALGLFVAAAAVAVSALNAAMASLERQRLATQSSLLASSVLAEIQLGIRPFTTATAKAFEPPFQDWTVETAVAPVTGPETGVPGLQNVEVVVRHSNPSAVRRLAEVLGPPPGADLLLGNQNSGEAP